LFSDSGFGAAPPPNALFRYADALGIAPQSPAREGFLPDAGFVKLRAGELALIASVASPGPAHQPGHAHCDALSFELTVGRERIVTDTGVFEYRPGPLRDVSRATASHATLQLDGREQNEVWAAHRIGGRACVAVVAHTPGRSLEATCAGFATPDTVHRRRFESSDDRLVVRDSVEGRALPVRLTLPLAPGLDARIVAGSGDGGQTLEIARGRAHVLTVELPAPGEIAWRIVEAPYFPEFGRQQDRRCLFGEGRAFRSGQWVFRAPR
jgi:hypothetical protein